VYRPLLASNGREMSLVNLNTLDAQHPQAKRSGLIWAHFIILRRTG
jgi:hypothetical protein